MDADRGFCERASGMLRVSQRLAGREARLQTVDVEAVEGAVVSLGRRAVGEGDAAAVQAGVGLAHGAHVDGAAAQPQAAVQHAPHAPAPAVRHARLALAAVPREDRFSLQHTYSIWAKQTIMKDGYKLASTSLDA